MDRRATGAPTDEAERTGRPSRPREAAPPGQAKHDGGQPQDATLPEDDAEPGEVGRVARRLAAALIWLRFVVPAIAVAVAGYTLLELPGISHLQSSPLTALIPQRSPAIRSERWMARHFAVPLTPRAAVVQRDPGGLPTRDQVRIVAAAVRADQQARADGGASGFAFPILNTGGLFPASRERGTTAITYLVFPTSVPVVRQAGLAKAYAARASLPGAPARPTGVIVGQLELAGAINDALRAVEIATIGLVALILAIYFRSIGAPLLTLATAGLAYVISTHVVTWVGIRSGRNVPQEVEPLIVVLLLGTVTDYSVFFLSGMRARLRAGEPRLQAARTTTSRFLPIVATAGVLVAGGVATLRAASLSFFQALGPGMAITVVIGMLLSVALVPCVMAIFGHLLFWPGRFGPGGQLGGPAFPSLVARLSGLFLRRRTASIVAVASGLVLAGAATGILHTRLGLNPISDLHGDQPANQGARDASRGFAPGIIAPTVVGLRGAGIDHRPAALARLQAELGRARGVAGVIGPADIPVSLSVFRSAHPDAARFLLILSDQPYGAAAIDRLHGLEAAMPRMLAAAGLRGAQVQYAGDTAISSDTIRLVDHDLAIVAGILFLVNLVVLMAFLRSLVAPLYLVAGSALALAATFGLTTYVFQDLLGYDQLTYYVPLAVGVLLVSFGSDYNVFIVGRIWQRSRRMPLREAITVTAPRAGRAITTAGVALGASFATLAIIPLASFAEFAFAMGAGILLDTFFVRTLLIPAVVSAVGEASWWPGMHIPRRAGASAG